MSMGQVESTLEVSKGFKQGAVVGRHTGCLGVVTPEHGGEESDRRHVDEMSTRREGSWLLPKIQAVSGCMNTRGEVSSALCQA